ncbi:MAG: MBL fold metallo-hydrolase [Variibacter sp.]|nr:MBL fold metallo-hydrolase [Variibacter sp.]
MLDTTASTLTVGRYRLDPIAEFEGPRMPPAAMFTQAEPARLAELLTRVPAGSYNPATNQLLTSVHSWLLRDDAGAVVLVDTCFGNRKHRLPSHPFFHMQENDWLARLTALGVEPRDVTLVINTHLHLDHVGWNTYLAGETWTPTFPNARHLMPRLEVELARAGTLVPLEANERSIVDSVLPIIDAGLADFVDPWAQILPDLRLVPCYGHSPGMLLVEISGDSKGAIVGGDPLHHPLQLLDPGINTGFCQNGPEAAASRRAFLERCADEGWAIAPTHFFVPRVTRVRRSGDAFDVAP